MFITATTRQQILVYSKLTFFLLVPLVGARIEAPKAPRGCGEGVFCAPSPGLFSSFKLEKTSLGALWVLFIFAVEWKLVRPLSGMH